MSKVKKETPVETEAGETTVEEVAKEEVANRTYELMVIFNPEILESKMKKKLEELEDFVVKGEGKVTHSAPWGKQNLAYKIGPHREGIYIVYTMELPPDFVTELNQHLRIDPEVLRYLLTAVPSDYTYKKYEAEEDPVKKERPKEGREKSSRNVSIKHSPPAAPAKKEEEPVKAVEEEATQEKTEEEKEPKKEEKPKEKPKAIDEDALDRKLDEILSDEDLNL